MAAVCRRVLNLTASRPCNLLRPVRIYSAREKGQVTFLNTGPPHG